MTISFNSFRFPSASILKGCFEDHINENLETAICLKPNEPQKLIDFLNLNSEPHRRRLTGIVTGATKILADKTEDLSTLSLRIAEYLSPPLNSPITKALRPSDTLTSDEFQVYKDLFYNAIYVKYIAPQIAAGSSSSTATTSTATTASTATTSTATAKK